MCSPQPVSRCSRRPCCSALLRITPTSCVAAPCRSATGSGGRCRSTHRSICCSSPSPCRSSSWPSAAARHCGSACSSSRSSSCRSRRAGTASGCCSSPRRRQRARSAPGGCRSSRGASRIACFAAPLLIAVVGLSRPVTPGGAGAPLLERALDSRTRQPDPRRPARCGAGRTARRAHLDRQSDRGVPACASAAVRRLAARPQPWRCDPPCTDQHRPRRARERAAEAARQAFGLPRAGTRRTCRALRGANLTDGGAVTRVRGLRGNRCRPRSVREHEQRDSCEALSGDLPAPALILAHRSPPVEARSPASCRDAPPHRRRARARRELF